MPAQTRPHALLVAFNRIGDLTLSVPLMRAIAQRSRLSVLTRPFGPAFLETQGYIEKAYGLPYPNRGRSGLGKLLLGGHRRALGHELGDADFDEVLIYETERNVIRDWLEDLFPGKVREMARQETPGTHALDLYRAAADSLGLDLSDYENSPRLDIPPTPEQDGRSLIESFGKRVVGIQTGSQRTHARRPVAPRPNLKSLSDSQWIELTTRMLRSCSADAVVFHGAPNEAPMVDALLAKLPADVRPQVHNVARDIDLTLLPAALAAHHALLSVDTGTAHIAAAVGCPLLVFFGPTNPAEFAPRGQAPVELAVGRASCQFCHGSRLYKDCRDNRCLNRLTDDELWGAWERLRGTIDGSAPAPAPPS